MKVTSYQVEDELAVLTAMIVSDQVLARVHTHLKGERKPFKSPQANTIAGWCLDCFTKYQKAPRKGIIESFRQWASKGRDEERIKQIEIILSSLSDNHARQSKGINVEQRVDTAERHFNKVRLERLFDAGQEDLRRGDPAAALEKITAFHPVTLAMRKDVEILNRDQHLLLSLLDEEESEVMVHYPQGLGEFFGPHLQRDGFISFMAPEKRGKSFWLLDLAWRAVLERRRTMFYSVGDMSEKQMQWRFATRIARRPRFAGEIRVPYEIKKLKGHESDVQRRVKTFKDRLFKSELRAGIQRVEQKVASQKAFIKTYCASNSSTSVADIRADIEGKIREGWVPDVVVIDYADILAPEPGTSGQDYRHQINVTWQALRKLSQDYHVLLVTATQSDASSYKAIVLRREHFSEDKRKLSHVTGIIGINQIEEEKLKGVYRLNWIVLREGSYSESRCVHVAGCLAIANPAIVSAW